MNGFALASAAAALAGWACAMHAACGAVAAALHHVLPVLP